MGATLKCYSPAMFLTSIVAEFWLAVTEGGCRVWIDAVASEANPADPISRPDEVRPDKGLSFASARKWRRLHEPTIKPPRNFRFPNVWVGRARFGQEAFIVCPIGYFSAPRFWFPWVGWRVSLGCFLGADPIESFVGFSP